jgi:hypothetical protein
MIKYSSLFTIITLFILTGACKKMDYNYSEYLDEVNTYSPKVTNLEAKSMLKKVLLTWDNPDGDVAKSLLIDYQDSTISTETMIDSILITNLEIKGYTITVYTRDAYDNLSVPVSVTAFPNGVNN